MAKQWSTIDFTETYTTGNTYDSTKNSIFGGLEVVDGVIRVPLPKAIPYLEQGNAVLLANSVYADSNYIYTVSTMATGLTVRVNRWNKKTLAWAGYIVMTLSKTSEINTCRDVWVNSGSTEVIVGFTAATALQGGLAWVYGLTANDWAGVTLPVGINTIAPRMCYLIRSGVIDRTVVVGAGTNFISHSSQAGTTLATQAGAATYTALTTIFTTSGWAVAYGGGLWVAGGEGTNSLAWSWDGMTWTGIASGVGNFGTRCRGVCYGEIPGVGGRWVAVGVGTNSIIYSNDGTNWVIPAHGIAATGVFTTGAYGVCWDGTKYWAVGAGTNTLASSPDGITWTGYGVVADGGALHSPFSTAGYGIAYNGSQYVAVGIGTNTIAYSSNGTTWAAAATGHTFTQGNAVCWGAPVGNIVTPGTAITPRWCVVGIGSSHTIAWSTDGINWTGAGVTMFPAVSGGNGVCFNGTLWTAVGTKGAGSFTAAYSHDCVTWVGVLANLPQTIGQAVGCSPAPNMYPAKVGSTNNVLSTISNIAVDPLNTGVNSGNFKLYIIQSTNTVAAPGLTLLDLSTLPLSQNGIIIILDTSRYSSAIMTSEYGSNLPTATLSQGTIATPGSNHGVGISGVTALFLTRGAAATARVGRVVLSRFTATTSTTKRARTSNVATLTFDSHNFTVSQRVIIYGVGSAAYNNGGFGKEPGIQVVLTAANATTISYVNIGPDEAETLDTTGRVIATLIGEDDYITDIPPLGATIQQAVNNWGGLVYDVSEENKYFEYDVGKNVAENVHFLYSANMPQKFEVWPSDNGIMEADPIGKQEGLGILSAIGFCYVPYHFVYDVSFPVLVQISSKDEIFQFPMLVVIDKSQARNATAVESGEVTFDICEFKTQEVNVFTYDESSKPLEAKLYYKCLDQTCPLGNTKITEGKANINTFVPKCYNGVFIAEADNYSDSIQQISTNEPLGSINLFLKPKHILKIDPGISGDEKAIISFASKDYSTSVYWPEQKEVELVEGDYNITAQLFMDSTLVLPAQSGEQCVKVPAVGIAGILGQTREDCFEMDIPEGTSTSVLFGGGSTEFYADEQELGSASEIALSIPEFSIPSNVNELAEVYGKLDTSKIGVTLK